MIISGDKRRNSDSSSPISLTIFHIKLARIKLEASRWEADAWPPETWRGPARWIDWKWICKKILLICKSCVLWGTQLTSPRNNWMTRAPRVWEPRFEELHTLQRICSGDAACSDFQLKRLMKIMFLHSCGTSRNLNTRSSYFITVPVTKWRVSKETSLCP
jgi:hypothetical protein